MTPMEEKIVLTKTGKQKKHLIYSETGETQYERIQRLLKEYER